MTLSNTSSRSMNKVFTDCTDLQDALDVVHRQVAREMQQYI
jgi:hypothetical protein